LEIADVALAQQRVTRFVAEPQLADMRNENLAAVEQGLGVGLVDGPDCEAGVRGPHVEVSSGCNPILGARGVSRLPECSRGRGHHFRRRTDVDR
jgi:hypothetical protein